jgi:hypothetical protein
MPRRRRDTANVFAPPPYKELLDPPAQPGFNQQGQKPMSTETKLLIAAGLAAAYFLWKRR